MIRKVVRILKENGSRSEDYLRMQVRRKMWPHIRSILQLKKDMGIILWRNRIKAMTKNH